MTAKPWMQLADGTPFDLLGSEPISVSALASISRSICRLPRFNGHTTGPNVWTVGEHCMLVEDILVHLGASPIVRLAGLVHDLPEGVYGDWTSPVQSALRLLGAGEALDAFRAHVDAQVIGALGVPGLDIHDPLVKRADLIALANERRDLMVACDRDWELPSLAMGLPMLAPVGNQAGIHFAYSYRLRRLRAEVARG